jgi:hypothetical protein
MDNLHELPSGVNINPPSFWFWMKAGAGFALGVGVMIPVLTWIALLTSGAVFGAMAQALSRR